jgi:hypothetical protein
MESRERYFTGNPQLDSVLSRIADRLDTIEGLRPNLVEGLYKLLADKEITTTSTTDMVFANDGLHILDTDGSHYLTISPGSNLSANRVLTITTGDSARAITLSGNPTLADWFDQAVKAASSPTFAGAVINGWTVTKPFPIGAIYSNITGVNPNTELGSPRTILSRSNVKEDI